MPSHPAPPASEPSSSLAQLLQLLGHLRHAHRGFLLARLSWLLAAAALALPQLGLLWVVIFHDPFLAAYGVWAGCAAAGLAVLCGAAAALWQMTSPHHFTKPAHLEPEALLLTKLVPTLGSSVAAAVALGQQTIVAGSLEDAHITATFSAARAADPKTRLAQVRGARLRPWRRACLRLLLLAAAACLVVRPSVQQLADAVQNHTPLERSAAPLWADVQVRVIPPPYSQMPTLDWAPMGAEIRVLRGSAVQLRGHTAPQFSRGLVCIGPSAGQPSQAWLPWQADPNGLWQIGTVVTATTAIEVAFVGRRGVGLIDPALRTLLAVQDAPPVVAIDAPEQDVVLKDHEQLRLRWHATDDIALKEVRLRINKDDGSQPVMIPQTGDQPVPDPAPSSTRLGRGMRRQGDMVLNARTLGLKEGVSLCLDIEATDTAPTAQIARSGPLRVRLFSALAHHETLLAQQAEVQDALVDWLALDYAMRAGPSPSRPQSSLNALVAQVVTVHGALVHLSQDLTDDALSQDGERLAIAHIAAHSAQAKTLLLAEKSHLEVQPFSAQSAVWRARPSSHARRIQTLEKDVLYLDALLAQGRLNVLQHNVKDLLAAKAELQDLVVRYRGAPDADVKAQLQARMAALRQQVQTLLQKMAALRPKASSGFSNSEAQAQDPWGKTMERLDEAMRNDDVDALAQDLEHLANMVDNAAKELTQQQTQDNQEQNAGLNQQLQSLAKNLQALTQSQRDLEQRGQQLAQKTLENSAGGSAGKLAALLQNLRDQLDLACHAGEAALPMLAHNPGAYQALKHGLEGLGEAGSLLKQQAIARAHEHLLQSVTLMQPARRMLWDRSSWPPKNQVDTHAQAQQHLHKAFQTTQHVQDELEKLLRKAAGPLPNALQAEARALDAAQQKLTQSAQDAQQEAAEAQEGSPVLGQEMKQQLGEAGQAMQDAAKAFGQGQLGQASRDQRRALQTLEALGQALQESQSGQGGLPQPTGAKRPQSRGGQGANIESEVAIPPAAADQPDPVRRRILDHAKEAPPLHYEDAVRRYYEALIR